MDFFKHSKPRVGPVKTIVDRPELHLGRPVFQTFARHQKKRGAGIAVQERNDMPGGDSSWFVCNAKSGPNYRLGRGKHDEQPDSSDSEEGGETESDVNRDNAKLADSNPEKSDLTKGIRNELSDLSFEELQQLRERIGTKLYNAAMFSASPNRTEILKRANKNRPREESSKVQVSTFREIFTMKKRTARRDPRFDDHSGPFDDRIHQHAYSFIKDIKTKEKEELKKALRKEHDQEVRHKMKQLLNRMENQDYTQKMRALSSQRAAEQKKAAIEKLKEGKRPFFVKKSEAKKQELAEKFVQLKKSGKLEKYLQKKRRKNATRDRQHLPV